jgi:hypothetical protein
MAALTPTAKMQFFKADGTPLVGGKLYTYTAGTTTPQTTFTDSAGGTANTNPVILDSRGEANIWLGGATYKFKLADANDVEIWTVDNISAPTSGVSPALSGNVTIDTDSASPALRITQTGTGPALRVQDSADPDLTPFVVDATGKVGIGTTSPSELLDVSGGNLVFTSSGGVEYFKVTPTNTETTLNAESTRDLVLSTNGVERARAGATLGFSAPTFTGTTSVVTNTINEYTAASGVTIDGVLLKDSLIEGQYRPITAGTAVTPTSTATVSFGSIPSWVKRITVSLSGISSTNTSVSFWVQLGTASGFEATGYTSSSLSAATTTLANDGSTTQHILMPASATTTATWAISGHAVFTNLTGNTWVGSSTIFGGASGNSWCMATSSKTLAGVLTQIRIQCTANYDAGSINIFYE